MQIDIVGSGPSLVLVHSLLTDSRAFDLVVPELSKTRRVVRVSLPGFGDSKPLSSDSPSIFDLGDFVAEALLEADVESDAAVLGNGFGAFVCLALAVTHGEQFGPLILSNGGAVFSDERKVAFTTMGALVSENGMEAVVDVAVRRIFPTSYLAARPEVIEQRRSVLVETDPDAFAASCLALRDLDLRPDLSCIKNPTLVIAGGQDQTTPPEMARDLAVDLPQAELVELEGCGHCPPLEQPEEFVSAIEKFLNRISTGS